MTSPLRRRRWKIVLAVLGALLVVLLVEPPWRRFAI